MLKRHLVLIFALIVLSAALIAPVAAQDATATPFEDRPIAGASEPAAETETITSGGTIMLLVGVGAVLVVGGVMILRENFKNRAA